MRVWTEEPRRGRLMFDHATMYIRDRSTRNSHQASVHLQARITNCPIMEGEAVHGQATRSVSAHDHLFASVRLMMNAIVLSSRSGSDWRSKWLRKQRRRKSPARNIRHLISKLLKMHSKARTAVSKLAKLMKRSEGSLRQKALKLGIGLGHQR